VAVAELFADDRASVEDLARGRASMSGAHVSRVLAHAASPSAPHAAERAINGASLAADEKREHAIQAGILRDIFGNPFRPATLDSAWLTSTVVALAVQMYESRDFGAMQDAGCDDEEVLSHCRDPKQVHVRGCWVADLVLGKV
jgi:hypothetical protein